MNRQISVDLFFTTWNRSNCYNGSFLCRISIRNTKFYRNMLVEIRQYCMSPKSPPPLKSLFRSKSWKTIWTTSCAEYANTWLRNSHKFCDFHRKVFIFLKNLKIQNLTQETLLRLQFFKFFRGESKIIFATKLSWLLFITKYSKILSWMLNTMQVSKKSTELHEKEDLEIQIR